jgi:hypothetical protein
VYACGSGEHGQLGNGRTGEYIVTAGKTAFDVKDVPSASILSSLFRSLSVHRSPSCNIPCCLLFLFASTI